MTYSLEWVATNCRTREIASRRVSAASLPDGLTVVDTEYVECRNHWKFAAIEAIEAKRISRGTGRR